MKSRTSLFNPTVFRKDLTRFAPAWVLYTVGLFMILTVVMADNPLYYRAANLAETLAFMAVINLGYGLLNAQLLFGDLYSARHCNALHAMPMRRECWFVTHVVSGLLFSFGPNLLMALVSLPMLGSGMIVAVWWLLAVSLQYLFFFGLAVCSALCVGNRFAMVLVYGIVNFFSLIVYWFYHTMYEPLLYGVFIGTDPFLLFCPVWKMLEHYELINVNRMTLESDYSIAYDLESVTLGEGWGYLGICAGLGLALLGIALVLYRRRKLESAGDFMAVRALEPVFLVLYTMCAAAGFQVFAELFDAPEYLFLALGLIVGFFTGRMLLMRTIRVFQPRGFLWFGVLAAAFLVSLLLTKLDPVGLTRYIPDPGQVREVKISTSYDPSFGREPWLSEQDDVNGVCRIHELILLGQTESTDPYNQCGETLSIEYVMDYGTITRKYYADCTSPAGQMAEEFFTRADYVLGTDDADEFMEQLHRVYYDKNLVYENGEIYMDHTNAEFFQGLVEAIMADCAAGNMAQNHGYHADEEQYGWLDLTLLTEDGYYDYYNVMIYPCCRSTVAYLEANPFPVVEEYYG